MQFRVIGEKAAPGDQHKMRIQFRFDAALGMGMELLDHHDLLGISCIVIQVPGDCEKSHSERRGEIAAYPVQRRLPYGID